MNNNHDSLVARVLEHARSSPNRLALVAGEEVVEYSALQKRILAFAGELLQMGVQPGDRVLLAADNRDTRFVAGYLACHLVRGVAVPLDVDISDDRLGKIIEIAKPKVLLSDSGPQADNRIGNEMGNTSASATLDQIELPQADDEADLLFTTGTTGQPKGVLLTHRNVMAAARHINAFIGNTADDREVLPLPLSHSFGLGRVRCSLLAGGTIVLVPGFTFPGVIFKALRQWEATGLSSVPAGFAVLLRNPENPLAEFSDQLRYIEIGSAPMPLDHKRKLMSLLPETRICMHYGLTEASRSAFIEFHESANNLDSIGRPSPGVKIMVIDNDLNPVAKGQTGRIAVQGDHVMKAYFRDSKATAVVLRNGWLDTGDYGRAGSDGLLYLDARESDLINMGGRKVAPREVENCLESHPAVRQCACIGTRDQAEVTGQSVIAILVAARGVESLPEDRELRIHVGQRLEPYKIPSAFRWVTSLPTSSSGKLQRQELRKQFGDPVKKVADVPAGSAEQDAN